MFALHERALVQERDAPAAVGPGIKRVEEILPGDLITLTRGVDRIKGDTIPSVRVRQE
jgi:hypothetical protein